jgi:lysyl-tRNA synthetase class 2
MKIINKQNQWQPSASLKNLRLREKILAEIRQFFANRSVLEVETPLLCSTTATDPHIASFSVAERYLQTSPEFAMKRLLAAGSGSIYQICKAFRNDEIGQNHNPEFTILEWYRPGFDHLDLMHEVDEFLQIILQTKPASRHSYAEIFQQFLKLNPHSCSITELKNCALNYGIKATLDEDRDSWLNLLMTHLIEPKLGIDNPVFIYDYPPSQAALARVGAGLCARPFSGDHTESPLRNNPPLALRFEVYINGIELANGFHELADAQEQRQRFLKDQQKRQQLGHKNVPIDERLLAALAHGFPDCAGVALGIDRLVMLAAKEKSIDKIMSFAWDDV